MKTLNLGTKFVMSLVSGLTALVMAAGFAFFPATAAYADEGTPPAPEGKRLEKALQREHQWLSLQQNHLDRANEIAAKVQGWIDELKARGKDTSALEAVLATFQQQVANAQSSHDTAASILSTHAGFDENGQVTDPAQARQTVKDARQALQDAHQTLRQAGHDLRQAIKKFREENRGK